MNQLLKFALLGIIIAGIEDKLLARYGLL